MLCMKKAISEQKQRRGAWGGVKGGVHGNGRRGRGELQSGCKINEKFN